MGIIKKGILGGFSGKVGSVVGSNWKGIDYIRSLPTSVTNPRTPGQVSQRGKFKTVVSFLSKISPMIKIGFKNYTKYQSSFNAAMSYNLLNAVTGNSGVYKMDFPMVRVSRGSLYRPISGEVQVENGEVTISWKLEIAGNGSLNDLSNAIIYNSTKNEAILSINGNERGIGYTSIDLFEHWKGDKIEVYLTFTSDDGRLVSDSLYLGQHEIPLI